MPEAGPPNSSCLKPECDLDERTTNRLRVIYTHASPEPANAGRIDLELDRAFDMLFEATLTSGETTDKSSKAAEAVFVKGSVDTFA